MATASETPSAVRPLCPVFGACGGCAYQDLPYEEELSIKERRLAGLLMEALDLPQTVFEPIVPSPMPYHYRHRLDITLRRRGRDFVFGFQLPGSRQLVDVESCAIARKEVSDFLPQLREQAVARLPEDYRNANLVVRSGDDGRVFWGGIGRRSLTQKKEDYLWTEIRGRRIFYSLETFFQANLSILPALIENLEAQAAPDSRTHFFDLYSGVGLFGICLAPSAQKVTMIEENAPSCGIARHNAAYHGFSNAEVFAGKVEAHLPEAVGQSAAARKIAIVDPPRQGLSESAAAMLAARREFESLFYLSCHPESLARDLRIFMAEGWRVDKVTPFDFFPKTAHLETLVRLKP